MTVVEDWFSFKLTYQISRREGVEIVGKDKVNFFVKQKYKNDKEGELLTQYTNGLKKITEDNYTEGLLINIISHNDEYETEIYS